MSKYVKFEKRTFKATVGEIGYDVISKKTGELLGGIARCSDWKKWVFITSDEFVFDAECLQDIVNFIKELK